MPVKIPYDKLSPEAQVLFFNVMRHWVKTKIARHVDEPYSVSAVRGYSHQRGSTFGKLNHEAYQVPVLKDAGYVTEETGLYDLRLTPTQEGVDEYFRWTESFFQGDQS